MLFLNDIREIKSQLGIALSNTSEDKILNFYLEYASGIIEEVVGRDLSRTERTMYFGGNGKREITLPYRPIVPPSDTVAFRVWHSENGNFGATSGAFSSDSELTYGDTNGFTAVWDQPDGTSRSGILVRIDNVWTMPYVRAPGLLSPFMQRGLGNFKVTYTAGYTVDSLPPNFRIATMLLIAKLRMMMPLGMELGSESYEERSVSYAVPQRNYLLSLVKPLVETYRNRVWG